MTGIGISKLCRIPSATVAEDMGISPGNVLPKERAKGQRKRGSEGERERTWSQRETERGRLKEGTRDLKETVKGARKEGVSGELGILALRVTGTRGFVGIAAKWGISPRNAVRGISTRWRRI